MPASSPQGPSCSPVRTVQSASGKSSVRFTASFTEANLWSLGYQQRSAGTPVSLERKQRFQKVVSRNVAWRMGVVRSLEMYAACSWTRTRERSCCR